MATVNVRTLKNKLTEYLDRAVRGENIEVTRNGAPVVRLAPIDPRVAKLPPKMRELVERGTIILPRKTGPWPKRRPTKLPDGVSVSEMLIEDRRLARF